MSLSRKSKSEITEELLKKPRPILVDHEKHTNENHFFDLLIEEEILKRGYSLAHAILSTLSRAMCTSMTEKILEANANTSYKEIWNPNRITQDQGDVLFSIMQEMREKKIYEPNYEEEKDRIRRAYNEFGGEIQDEGKILFIENLLAKPTFSAKLKDDRVHYFKFVSLKADSSYIKIIKMSKLRWIAETATEARSELLTVIPYNATSKNLLKHAPTVPTIPQRFNKWMDKKEIIAGADYWNFIGDHEDTYEAVTEILISLSKSVTPAIEKIINNH